LQAASVGKVSGNLTVCQGNLTVFYGGASVVYDEYAESLYAQAGRSTYEILKSIDPIIFSCYFSLFEYVIAVNIYQDTVTDPLKMVYNLAHNLGSIYDVTEEGIHRSIDFNKNWNDTFYWSRMGHAAGTVF